MPKKKTGRISNYDKLGGDAVVPAITSQLAKLGAIDEDLAAAFGVDRRTITNWKNEYPKFKDALNAGKASVDDQVEKSLFQRATGYEHPEDKIFYDSKTGDPVIVPTTKHYPPDTTAAIFWLKNRRPDLWRDKQEVEHGGKVLTKIELEIVSPKS